MRSKGGLHKTKLDDFRIYLESFWWVDLEIISVLEVLRMKHNKYEGELIVSNSLESKEHYTTDGIADELFMKWRREAHNV